MNLLKICLVAILFLTVVPFDGFCFDADSDHIEACAVACDAACCPSGAVLPADSTWTANLFSAFYFPFENYTHPAPHISVRHRPPIVLS